MTDKFLDFKMCQMGLYETYCFTSLSVYGWYVRLTTDSLEYKHGSYPFVTR